MDTKPLEKLCPIRAPAAARAGGRPAGAGAAHRQRRPARASEAPSASCRQQIAADSRKQAVIDRVAYTWFNRFCALRFMDANRYTRIGVVSPAEGFTQPEILQEAKQGHIDEDLQRRGPRRRSSTCWAGSCPPPTRRAKPTACCWWAPAIPTTSSMPFLFEKIADYTELLMPDDLLSENSILHSLREALTAEACQDVEVIGWLYQFYISERKDEVFEALKKNRRSRPRISPPPPSSSPRTGSCATWWRTRWAPVDAQPPELEAGRADGLLHRARAGPETDFLKIGSPEEIKVCDPACGSGHMLTYAFDLLYAIYEEAGLRPGRDPRLILAEEPVRHRDRRARRGPGRLCADDESARQETALLQPATCSPISACWRI